MTIITVSQVRFHRNTQTDKSGRQIKTNERRTNEYTRDDQTAFLVNCDFSGRPYSRDKQRNGSRDEV
jgi:hypothetical protein